jgi:hypothetical protein
MVTAMRMLFAVALIVLATPPFASGQTEQPAPTLDAARHLFYNARYDPSAELARQVLPASSDDELARDEIRTSALLFQLKGLLESPDDKKRQPREALARCLPCADLIAAFMADIRHGQEAARARLEANRSDEAALFYLGKLNLNYVWLQLGPLRRKTGWDEYWEARRSLDAALKVNPRNVRARVARAWIDYIVDTRMPWGARWLLGGGDKKRALRAMHEAAASESDFFTAAEAEFGLWDMLVRERQMAEATEVAERLAARFPANLEVARFLEKTKNGRADSSESARPSNDALDDRRR